MAGQNRYLLTDEEATGAAVTFGIGGQFMFIADATTWNGATVTLQVQGPKGNWISVGAPAIFTAPGVCIVNLAPGTYRAAISVAVPTDMTAQLISVD